MEALARITLLAPLMVDGAERVISLRNGQRSLIGMSGGGGNIADPSMHVGWNDDNSAIGGGGNQNRFSAAETIEYFLSFEDETMRTVTVPVETAMRYFGDWTIVPGQLQANKLAYSHERMRVASVWGDYARMRHGRKAEVKGGYVPDPRIIGAPLVPKVIVSPIDTNGRHVGEIHVPWKLYHWETDIDAMAVREAARQREDYGYEPVASAGLDLATFTPEQLASLAKQLAPLIKASK